MTAIATIKGTFLKPGVSKNRRLYSREHIAKAVTEAQKAIDAGETMAVMTHHGARDASSGDVTRTAGRITKVSLAPDGSAQFEAEIANTQAGRDIAALVQGSHLKGVSMASTWNSQPHNVRAPDGSTAQTADAGFTLKGIDFTHSPGVVGAQIDPPGQVARIGGATVDYMDLAAEAGRGELIFESMEDIVMTETNAQPQTAFEARRQRMAFEVAERANRAEADLENASIQDLEALAALLG